MNTTPHVSIIVPIYEGRENFAKLLADLRNQTLQNIEIILVDDCGQDGAFEEAVAASKEDNRIVLIRNEHNIGQGICRNKGIECARGEYLAFADADDIIPADFYEKLYTKAKCGNYKVVKGNRVAVYPDGRQQFSPLNEDIIVKLKKNIPLHCAFSWEHQTALFSREHIMQSGARNAEGRRDQDTAFLLWVLYDVSYEEFAFAPSAVYYYRKHSDAVTTNINYVYMVELMKSFAFKLNFLKTKECSAHTLNSISYQAEDRFASRLCAALQHKDQATDEALLELIAHMRKLLRDFVSIHPLPTPKEYTSMALDANITDAQLLKKCRERAAKMRFGDFSPKRYQEVPAYSPENSEVHIATVAHEGGAVFSAVALYSLKKHKRPESIYNIHVFVDSLSQMWLNVLQELNTPDFRIDFYEEIDMVKYHDLHNKLTREDMTKAFLCDKLPTLDKVIFCSSNVVVREDLSMLYSVSMGDACIATSLAYDTKAPVTQNEGIQLFNLRALREKSYSNQAREKALRLVDIVENDEIVALHPRYGLPLASLLNQKINIWVFNRLVGTAYRSVWELTRDARVLIYPRQAELCLHNPSGVYDLWRDYLKSSPAHFVHESQLLGSVASKPEAPKKEVKIPDPVKPKQAPARPHKKEIRVLGVPVWSRNTKTGKCVYRLFGIQVFRLSIR